MAKELEHRGAHMLAIKDMSGLLKPYAAKKLVSTLKQEIGIPIQLHTHDTTGNQVAALLLAAEAAAPDGTGDSWNTSSRHSSSAASFRLIMSSLPQKLPWKIVFSHISGFFVKSHPMAAVV